MGKGGQQPPRISHGTTKDEQRAALQAFAAMDVDGDGELTAEEIYRALSKHDSGLPTSCFSNVHLLALRNFEIAAQGGHGKP